MNHTVQNEYKYEIKIKTRYSETSKLIPLFEFYSYVFISHRFWPRVFYSAMLGTCLIGPTSIMTITMTS